MQENVATVTVVIPTYNRPNLLQRAIASVHAQTFDDYEILVVDDHGEQRAIDHVPDDPRIRVLRHELNLGGNAARSTGVKAAQSEFVALLDDDDMWHPEKLRKQVTALRANPDAGFCYTWADARTISDNADADTGYASGELVYECRGTYSGNVLDDLLHANFINSATMIARRDAFTATGTFDPAFVSCQDWEMWVRIAERFPFICIPEVLAVSYHHGLGRVSTSAKALLGYEQFVNKFRDLLNDRPASLAKHLEFIGYEHYKLGDYPRANQFLSEALRVSPWSLRRCTKRLLAGARNLAPNKRAA